MSEFVQQIYPVPGAERRLIGLYLGHDIRRQTGPGGRAFVYSNFVTSLDGRIAIPRPDGDGLRVPPATANDRDWRLFQELAAQADILITTGRYLRDWAAGRAQELLAVDDPRFSDLRDWRRDQGLPPQPDLAIISGSLRFPIPALLTANGRRAIFVTNGDPDPARVAELTATGPVLVAGRDSVDGAAMVQQLSARGYRTIYSTAGPKVMEFLVKGRVLDRLYLTFAGRLLGGDPFATILDGARLDPAYDMRLATLYFDAAGLAGVGQLFAAYDGASAAPTGAGERTKDG